MEPPSIITQANPLTPILSSSKNPLEKKMGEIVANTVQGIAADYEMRRSGWKQNPDLLKGGIWMQNEYFKALKELGESAGPRLKHLVDNGYFYHPFPPKSFGRIPSNSSASGYELSRIQLKLGQKPSEALTSLLEKKEFCLLDCTLTCQIGQYNALLDALGPDKFDKLFSPEGEHPMLLSQYYNNPLCMGLLSNRSKSYGTKEDRPIQVGDRLAYRNYNNYNQKHKLMGDCQAINVTPTCSNSGKQMFVGLGLPVKGLSESELEQYLVDEYNKKPQDLEPLCDEIANKLIPGGKAQFKATCDYLDTEASEETTIQSVNHLLKQCPSHLHEGMKEHLVKEKEKYIPRNVTEIKKLDKEFGYDPTTALGFNIPLIQKLIKAHLNQVSWAFIAKNK